MTSGASRRRSESLAPALFPFLAVMVCTIGALVFILTIAVAQASNAAKNDIEEIHNDQQQREDMLELAATELLAERDALTEEIARAQANLTHLEDHTARLYKELDELERQEQLLKTQAVAPEDSDRLEELREQAQMLEEQIQQSINARKTTKPAYSVVPYNGPNGTARRPIYLECTVQGVTIQPEGIFLGPDDLRPPHGPGNPLDACLRTIRARLQQYDQRSFAATPYPLLLVRPDGIASYALARAALSAWEDQQGYELIEAEMDLAFPESMPGLKKELSDTLSQARKRQVEMIAAMPKSYANIDSFSDQPVDLAEEFGDGNQTGSSRELSGDEQFIEGGGDEWPTIPGANPFDPNQAMSSKVAGTVGESSDASTTGELGASMPYTGDNSQLNTPHGGEFAEGMVAGQSGQNRTAQSQGAANGSPASSESSHDSEQMSPELRQELAKNRVEQSAGNSPNTSASTVQSTQQSTSSAQQKSKKSSSIAQQLGTNWAIRRNQLSSTPVQRSITLQVLPDRWQMLDSNGRIETEIPLSQGPRVCSQQLSTAVKQRVAQWGVAVNDGYWVPTVRVQATADAQWAVEQLRLMFADSGVELQIEPPSR